MNASINKRMALTFQLGIILYFLILLGCTNCQDDSVGKEKSRLVVLRIKELGRVQGARQSGLDFFGGYSLCSSTC